jgi:hypothetical protein
MRSEVVWIASGLALLAGGVFFNELSYFGAPARAQPTGTLQAVQAAEWLAATPADRLATAADWALAFPEVRNALRASRDQNELSHFASTLRDCVTDAARDELSAGRSTSTADIAAACGVLLGWVTPRS